MFGTPVITAALVSFVLSVILIPHLIRLSIKNHWFDDINHRKIHTGNISRLAGIAIFVSMAAGLAAGLVILKRNPGFEIPAGRMISFLAAYLIIFIIGLIDDFRDVKPRYKFFIQIITTLIIIIPGRYFSVIAVPFTDYSVDIGFFGYILTAVWIIGASNAINLIDGMDGLSGGLTAIATFFLGLISIATGNIITAVFSLALFGSLIGFLVFNFPPAKIFMGDAGALFLGLAISSFPLLEINYNSDMAFIIAVSIIFIPVMDTLTSMLRRMSRKQSPFHPDREHLHHKLMELGLSVKQILFIVYSISILLCLSVFMWSATGSRFYIGISIIIWLAIISVTLILEKHHAVKKR